MSVSSRLRIVLTFLVIFCMSPASRLSSQDSQDNSILLEKLPYLKYARQKMTTEKNVLSGVLSNRSGTDKEALILSSYKSGANNQYGRKVWIPANSQIEFDYSVGPIGEGDTEKNLDIQSILYDSTQGKNEVIKSVEGNVYHASKVRTDVLGKNFALIGHSAEELHKPLLRYEIENVPLPELEIFLQLVARMQNKDDLHYEKIDSGILPSSEDAYKSLAFLVLAGDQITYDAAGCRALKNWIERDGGRLWVMYDRVSQSTVNSLLGEVDFIQELERTEINTRKFMPGEAIEDKPLDVEYQNDKASPFVKVLTPQENILYSVNGWPAAIQKKLGEGFVIFTMVGSEGWTRSLRENEPHPYRKRQDLPVPVDELNTIVTALSANKEESHFEIASLERTLEEKIGHSIMERSRVVTVLGAFCGSLLVIGIVLKLFRKTSYFGLIGPLVSLGVGGFFINTGNQTQHSTPPTIATYQFANTVRETNDLSMSGIASVYYPQAYNGDIGLNRGGEFEYEELTQAGGIKYIQTDLDSWVYEGINIPAGSVQTGQYEIVKPLSQPLTARGIYDAEGLKVTVSSDLFDQFSDSLIITPQARMLRVDHLSNGEFKSTPEDVLESKVYIIPESGLMDVDQRRHDIIYSEYLTRPVSKDEPDTLVKGVPSALEDGEYLLTWTKPVATDIDLQEGAVTVGDLLVAIPLAFNQSESGSQVSVPAPMVSYRSVRLETQEVSRATAYFNGKREWNTVSTSADTVLRFQIPESVLPLELEKVVLRFQVKAPDREFKIDGFINNQKETIETLNSPNGVYTFEITRKDFLSLDEEGGLLLSINVGSAPSDTNGQSKLSWKIDYLELEAYGTIQ